MFVLHRFLSRPTALSQTRFTQVRSLSTLYGTNNVAKISTNVFHKIPTRGIRREERDDQETLYVSNVHFNLSAEDVKSEFAQCGVVHHVHIPKDRETGRSRGIAFVTVDKSEANSVIQGMSGREISGRTIQCSIARKKIFTDQRQSQEPQEQEE